MIWSYFKNIIIGFTILSECISEKKIIKYVVSKYDLTDRHVESRFKAIKERLFFSNPITIRMNTSLKIITDSL